MAQSTIERMNERISPAARVAIFVAIAFGGSFGIAILFWMLGGRAPSPEARAMWMLYMLPPAFGALIVQGPVRKAPILSPLGLTVSRSGWFPIAWLLPIVFLAGALATAAILPSMRVSGPGLGESIRFILFALPAGLFNGLFALAEELGFRGFLLQEVRGSIARRTFLVGLAWGAWLVPLALAGLVFPGEPWRGAITLVAWALALSPAITLIRIASGSVIAAALFRGTLMAMWPVAEHLVEGGSVLLRPIYGATGIVGALVASGVVYAMARRSVKGG